MSWNINGWTSSNQELRTRVIHHLNPDIICLSETHLDEHSTIVIPNYKYFAHNRQAKHKDAPFTHGGVGLLVKEALFEMFVISVFDQTFDGILSVTFKHRFSGYTFVVFSCYLPPENSLWCDVTNFYGHLISLIYSCENVDSMYICGDFNGRIGAVQDFVQGIDDLEHRVVVDEVKNKLGETLLDFMSDMKLCVTNGRVGQSLLKNNFTCISGRGKSVVDYIMVPQNDIAKCLDMNVYTPGELIEKCNLYSLISVKCKPPDHSILMLEFIAQSCVTEKSCKSCIYTQDRKLICRKLPDDEIWRSAVCKIIENIRAMDNNQNVIDRTYDEFCTTVHKEMNRFYVQCNSKHKKKFKYHKPYWDEELTESWKHMHICEVEFLKCPRNRICYHNVQNRYVCAQATFDKLLHRKERRYNREKVSMIEQVQTNNPREFWRQIKQLGPRSKNNVPMQVYDGDELTSDIDKVLKTYIFTLK